MSWSPIENNQGQNHNWQETTTTSRKVDKNAKTRPHFTGGTPHTALLLSASKLVTKTSSKTLPAAVEIRVPQPAYTQNKPSTRKAPRCPTVTRVETRCKTGVIEGRSRRRGRLQPFNQALFLTSGAKNRKPNRRARTHTHTRRLLIG